MLDKETWLRQATIQNPNVSGNQLSEIYDQKVAPQEQPQQIQQPQQPQQIQQPQQPQQQQQPHQFSEDETTRALTNLKTPHQQVKIDWIKEAHKYNPNVDINKLSEIYDKKMVPQSQQEVPIEHKVNAIKNYYENKQKGEAGVGYKDPDSSAGLDHSDKMSMLGSLLIGGQMGAKEGLVRIKQLLSMPEGMAKTFTKDIMPTSDTPKSIGEEFEREKERDKSYKEAQLSHPTVTALSEFMGSQWPSFMVPGGKIGELAEKAALKLGAGKAIKALAYIGKHAPSGVAAGALQYDPTGESTQREVLGATAASLALPIGGKLVRGLSHELVPVINKLVKDYGVKLPVYPTVEKILHYLPLSGISGVIKERKKQLLKIGSDIYRGIVSKTPGEDYEKIFHGELLKELGRNKNKLKILNDRADKISEKVVPIGNKGLVNFENVRDRSKEYINEMKSLQEGYKNPQWLNKLKLYSETKNDTYKNANEMRKFIGNKYGQMLRASRTGGVSDAEFGQMKSLYGAINADMDDYANKIGGNLKKIHGEANKLYLDKVHPFSKGDFSHLTEHGYRADKIIGEFLKPDQKMLASNLISYLPKGNEKGITAARAALLRHAYNKAALSEDIGFNPLKFVNEALKLGEVNKIVYSPEQLGALKGYKRLIYLTRKLSSESIETGGPEAGLKEGLKHLVSYGVGGVAFYTHPAMLVATLMSSTVAGKILTSSTGQNILMRIAQLSEKASAEQFDPLLRKLFKTGFLGSIALESQT
jgi:hypothetical protein